MADEDTEPAEEQDPEGAAAAAAVAALAALIGADVAKALNEDSEEHRLALLSALAAQAFTLAYEQAGGTGSSVEEARAYVYSLRPAFGLLNPDGSEAQQDRMTDIIAHSAVSAGTLAAVNDNAGPDEEMAFEWRTQQDDRVRDMHQPVHGQVRAAGQAFDVGGHPQRYPGHPVGPPEAWINCRCYLAVQAATRALAAAAPEPHTGIAMVARPSDPESLAVEGGLPADELHVTLGYFGKTDDPELDPTLQERLAGFLRESPLQPHTATVGGTANIGDDDPQASVLLLESEELQRARDTLATYATPDGKHPHFTPHMTLGYGTPLPEEFPPTIDLSHAELWWGDERTPALVARAFNTDKRKKMADSGTAMPDGSYPIANVEDLKNAIQAIGRAKDPDAVKRHIRKRARALNAEHLIPESWTASGEPDDALLAWAPSSSPPGTHDAPGWLTNPKETQRLRTYWTKGEGAAKIAWGSPGDLTRCVKHLGKYVTPNYVWGTCQNLHFEALGYWNPESGPQGSASFEEINAAINAAFAATIALEEDMPPPLALFENPNLDGPTPQTIRAAGDYLEYVGHLASWETCHVGITGECIPPPRTASGYAHFRLGEVETDGGFVSVGHITQGTGHASTDLTASDTVAHYDNTGTVVADVAVGEDEYGIWAHGIVRPGITEDQLHALRAGVPSGDWRRLGGNLELVGALIVNVPGFPIHRPELAASAAGQDLALVAAGIVLTDPNANADRVAIAVLARLDQREADKARRQRAAALVADITALRVGALTSAAQH